MKQPIGGYFEWEFPPTKRNQLHKNAVLLNSCRNALQYVLERLPKITKLWIPYFTCEVVLEPLKRQGVPYEFYHVNSNLELAQEMPLDKNEYLVYTNYYGIKDDYVKALATRYGDHLIIDNAQALFSAPITGSHQVYSPRKFIGMPDGGLAVTPLKDDSASLPQDVSYDRCAHLLKRIDLHPTQGYADFQKDDDSISGKPVSRMSLISQKIFESVNLESICQRRRENFKMLHDSLGSTNKLSMPDLQSFSCPLVYPYWTHDGRLKKKLIANNIFVATYWPNVLEWTKQSDLEYELASNVVCLPIDQRYGENEMKFIINEVNNV